MENNIDPFDCSDIADKFIEELIDKRIRNGANMMHIFRLNYDKFEKIIDEVKKQRVDDVGVKSNSYDIIREILTIKKAIVNPAELPNSKISSYMATLRKERAEEKSANHSTAIKNGLAKKQKIDTPVDEPTIDTPIKGAPINLNQGMTSITELRFPGITKHKLDWEDSTWTIDDWKKKFKDWDALRMHHNEFPNGFRPKKLEDGTYEWSDFWECVWRHLYNVANEHEISAYDQTYYAGMKKVSMEHGKFWKDLHDARTTLKEKYNLNPVGVGGIKA